MQGICRECRAEKDRRITLCGVIDNVLLILALPLVCIASIVVIPYALFQIATDRPKPKGKPR